MSHRCYADAMSTVAIRELRNHTRQVLDRVDAGEIIVITVDGRPMAELRPLSRRSRFLRADAFDLVIGKRQADAALIGELAEMLPDSTDDLSL